MNIAIPSGKRIGRAPYIVALLGTLAVAAVLAVFGSNDSQPSSSTRSFPVPAVTDGYMQPSSLTFILVASQEQADELQRLRAEDAAFGAVQEDALNPVIILVAGTLEEEQRALDTVHISTDTSIANAAPPVYVVDARGTDFIPR